MTDDQEVLQLFIEEARDYLGGIENDLLQLEVQGGNLDDELVNKVFRSVHSIKGSAGCLGFSKIQAISHALETILSFIRDRTLIPLPQIISVLLGGFDLLARLAETPLDDSENITEQLSHLDDLIREVIPPRMEEILDATPVYGIPRLGELLIQESLVTEADIEEMLAQQKQLKEDFEKAPQDPGQSKQPGKNGNGHGSIRVDTGKLDHLLNIVGEAVISQAHVMQMSSQLEGLLAEEVRESMARLEQDLRLLQSQIMNIRMVPIGPMLERFHRVVRDLALSTGKKIDLVISGEETEIDKTILEKLGDPLKHMIRNAIDHAIEPPELRISLGKPENSSIMLSAYHEGGSIVIEISDDGRGLNREAILAKARKLGLVHGEPLSDEQVYALIFHPGFSTAEQVTDISGRGVGMDVVKRNLEALRGRIEIQTEKGQGSTFRLRLPLTMAIVDGLLIRIQDSHYVLPLAQVEECVDLTQEEFQSHHGRNVFTLRGKLIPYLRLGDFFHAERKNPTLEQIAIVGVAGERIGLVVDEVIGDLQTVIKPLGNAYLDAELFSGATIMGSGEVALIVDVPNLVRLAQEEEEGFLVA